MSNEPMNGNPNLVPSPREDHEMIANEPIPLELENTVFAVSQAEFIFNRMPDAQKKLSHLQKKADTDLQNIRATMEAGLADLPQHIKSQAMVDVDVRFQKAKMEYLKSPEMAERQRLVAELWQAGQAIIGAKCLEDSLFLNTMAACSPEHCERVAQLMPLIQSLNYESIRSAAVSARQRKDIPMAAAIALHVSKLEPRNRSIDVRRDLTDPIFRGEIVRYREMRMKAREIAEGAYAADKALRGVQQGIKGRETARVELEQRADRRLIDKATAKAAKEASALANL